MDISTHLDSLLAIIRRADEAIMRVYNDHSAVVEIKQDNTPLTQADMASHQIITSALTELTPDIPIVSEEGDDETSHKTVQGDLFWLLDPIDGTKEFIARTGQFCICLALVENGQPIFGIVSAPAVGTLYYGGSTLGSFKIVDNSEPTPIHVSGTIQDVVLGSRTEFAGPTADYIKVHFPDAAIKQIGSQLKLPYIAEGLADAYPRLNGPLHLWDLAPGHAILEGAGGSVTRLDGSVIDYRDPSLMAGDFIAKSGAQYTISS